MKITRASYTKIEFSTLDPGDFFLYNTDLYRKLHFGDNGFSATRMVNGEYEVFAEWAEVVLVECAMTWSLKTTKEGLKPAEKESG